MKIYYGQPFVESSKAWIEKTIQNLMCLCLFLSVHTTVPILLAPTHKHKIRFFISLSKRLYGGLPGDIIENDLKKVADKRVDKVRECYSGGFKSVTDSDFSWMIVHDACFILELFRLYYHHHRQPNFDFTDFTATAAKVTIYFLISMLM
jgi:hypothetical protein